MPDAQEATPSLPVWRRSRSAAATPMEDSDLPLMCGGPDLTIAETEAWLDEQEQKRKREKEEAEAREREEAEARKTARHSSASAQNADEEDEDKAAEKYRNDRYAVKLLRQEDSVWGGGGADTGMLG